jgi:glycyl-tRNA synthetase beta chain
VVADAVYDQYLPASAKDDIPRSAEGIVLGLADRVDTITGMFGLGMEPTGSKDPFALRRAANSIVRLLAESSLELKLSDVLAAADVKAEIAAKLHAFFGERIDFYLREGRDQAYDVVKAVVAAGSDDLRDLAARAEAVTAVRGSEDFLAVSAAFKRMKNILTQAAEKIIIVPNTVDAAVLSEPTEIALAARSAEVAATVEMLRATGDYRAALEAISTLRPQVDAFFEAVMVMAPDEAVRANRLALLARITQDFSRIADFSEIVSA